MSALYRSIAWALGVAGILVASIGVILAYTWAYPDVQCSGDFCGITWNAFTMPAMLIGTGLGIASVIMFLGQRFGGASPRSIK
jgi:hypothetical protein